MDGGANRLLTTLNRMTGMPVVLSDVQIGYVERAVADLRHGRLQGVIIRRGIGMARWCDQSAIALVGRECVLLRQRPGRLPDLKPQQPVQVFLSSGQWAGTVSDVVLRGDNLALQALEVSTGPLQTLLGRRVYARAYRSVGHGRQVVVPRLLSWTQLEKEDAQ